ncbi:hypothetical protein LB534_27955 [Mesorhizobium sp. CA18]|uniref:phosphotransferase-like protein n=1 Tax=unclassified Mesorhizobium TaxID=325217 RepID=UPI001CCFD560|nr:MULTISPECIES: hypothetical protein [unclassified Mesorhizobium]MBZ9829130.1 hypothetical protein [Mesorhizobium sp. CA18]MBZ9838056.1 hypothetical protein [Mesorhizobium sp. CA3]
MTQRQDRGPQEVLETRESRRADRLPGLARWQFERVHLGVAYDLELDTSRLMPANVPASSSSDLNCSDLHSWWGRELPGRQQRR